MSYKILKPLNLGGHKRVIGDIVDKAVIDSKRVYSLVKGGYITEVDSPPGNQDEREETPYFSVPIVKEDQEFIIPVNEEMLSFLMSLMQMDIKDAEKEIDGITDQDALIILNACDSRKGIKNASEKRSLLLNDLLLTEDEEEGEQLEMADLEERVGDN